MIVLDYSLRMSFLNVLSDGAGQFPLQLTENLYIADQGGTIAFIRITAGTVY